MERAAGGSAPAMVGDNAARRRVACPARGAPPYLPRRPQASPLYRVLADHFDTLERVHEEHFEPAHGPLRRAARAAVGRFLDCGLLEHGFARVHWCLPGGVPGGVPLQGAPLLSVVPRAAAGRVESVA